MASFSSQIQAPFADTVYTDELLEGLGSRYSGGDPADLLFDLGAWSAGLESFLNVYDRSISDSDRIRSVTKDRLSEFRLTHSALARIADLLRLARKLDRESAVRLMRAGPKDLDEQSSAIEECLSLNSALIKSSGLGYAEWKAWRSLLADRLRSGPISIKLENASYSLGAVSLPPELRNVSDNAELAFADRSAIAGVTSRLGRILRTLKIVGRMLDEDEPLKPSILLFCSIFEQTRGLIDHIDISLSRFPNEESELFALLDGASYMASLELKKAYFQELTGIVGLRPAPSVYARVETAHALLNDSFQQILTGFAKIIRPGVETAELFPEFSRKLTESLTLRTGLAAVLKAVQAAESSPETKSIEHLRGVLGIFLGENLGFLFYKDREAFERFCEEVHAVDEKKELVPILHRFAAYAETLFRQVNMRAVLINHPFEIPS